MSNTSVSTKATQVQITSLPCVENIYTTHFACNLQNELKYVAAMVQSPAFTDDEKATFILMASNHQYRLSMKKYAQTQQQAIVALKNSALWRCSFTDFEKLYATVCKTLTDPGTGTYFKGIGPLALYDIAKRLGACLTPAVLPTNFVYLAAGAKEGAKNLLNVKKLNDKEPVSTFQRFFHTLKAYEIEDVLCIMKHVLSNGGVSAANYTLPNPWSATNFYKHSMQQFPALRTKINNFVAVCTNSTVSNNQSQNP